MHVGLRVARVALALAGFAALVLSPSKAATLRLNARAIYERGVTSNITLSKDGSTVQLQSGEVIQDDGPASGFSYKPNQEKLSPGIAIRKQLLIADPRASKAVLMVAVGGNLNVLINGHPQKLSAPQKTGWEWQAYTIDPATLKPGLNNIVISGTGMVKIARADDSYAPLPHRSARSTDGGKSWSVDRLGPSGDIAGEYYVRLYLEHFKPGGSILLPVMDVANLEGKPLAPTVSAPGPLQVALSAAPDSKSGLTLRARSGESYVPDPRSWSQWMPLDREGSLQAPRGRFVQLEIKLATTDPRVTPKLTELTINTEPVLADDWTGALKVVDSHNEEIVRTSIPFRYEPFTDPRLKELRTRYHLDEVVGSAKTDLEVISKLAAWSSRNWPWQQWHLDQFYPSWDALDILRKLPDGKPVGGFCQQYDVVFLQACESFGFVGRDISIDSGNLGRPTVVGHEPMEIWSNQFHKWIWIDGTAAYYPEDPAAHTPLSLYEVRQRQLRVLRGQQPKPMRIVQIVDSVLKWRGLDVDMSFAEMRLIPRSNFLEQKYPIPLNNGKGPWTWNGFYVWTDEEAPAELIHPNLVTRYGNFEWTLNQAHYVLEPTAAAGEFRVHLDTETPGFETFLAQIDGGDPSPVEPIFPWKLHPGHNRLKVWPRNNAGRDGIASWIELDMPAS